MREPEEAVGLLADERVREQEYDAHHGVQHNAWQKGTLVHTIVANNFSTILPTVTILNDSQLHSDLSLLLAS